MYPVLIDWGPIFLPSWHVFFVLGALASYIYLIRMQRWVMPEVSEGDIARLFVCGYISGYFGARLLSIVVEERARVESVADFMILLFSLGPMTFYGGFLGATLVGSLYAWYRRIPIAYLADLAMPAGILGLAIGRIGCFLNGDDYGRPTAEQGDTAPWWSVIFPNLDDGIARIPVQLIEAAVALAIVILAVAVAKQRRWHFGRGYVGATVALLYALSRFFLEFFRGDPGRGHIWFSWLSTSQFISMLVTLICGVYLFRRSHRTR